MGSLFCCLVLLVSVSVYAQWRQDPTTGSRDYKLRDRTVLQGQVATTTDFGVRLVEPQQSARQRKAVVQVSVDGLELVDPRAAQPDNEHQAHIVYKLDAGPEQATVSKRFEIDNLSPGDHTLTVYLAANNGEAISPSHDLKLSIPK